MFDEPVGRHATRRQLLTLAGLAVGAGVVTVAGTPGVAAAAPEESAPEVLLEPIADDVPTGLVAGTGAAVVRPRHLAVRVINRAGPLSRGTTIALTFDPRLYAPLSSPVLTIGGRGVAATSAITTDAQTGAATCTMTLTDEVPALRDGAAPLVASVGAARPRLFPFDVLHEPGSVVAAAEPRSSRLSGSRHRLDRGGRASTREGEPWGVELGACWSRHTWGPGSAFHYFYPARLTVTGSGPGRTPAPPALTIAVDPRLVQRVEPIAVRLNDKRHQGRLRRLAEHRDDAVYESRWVVPTILRAGDRIDIDFTVSLLDPGGGLPTIKHPLVTVDRFRSPGAQRVTGRETISRQDAVWQ